MPVTFDGVNRLMVVTAGTTSLDVESELYSPWKDWVLAGNAGFAPAFRTFGGDPTSAGQFAPKFFFLQNGWKVYVDGNDVPNLDVAINLYVEGGGDPFIKLNGATVNNKLSDIPVIENNTGSGLDPTQDAMLLALFRAHFNKRDVAGNVIKIYDTDGTTILYQFQTDVNFSVIDPLP